MRTRRNDALQRSLWFIIGVTTFVLLLGDEALAGNRPPASSSPSPSASVPTGPLVHVSTTGTAWFVLLVGLGIALVWLTPLAYDAMKTYKREIQNRDRIIDHLIAEAARSDRQLDLNELQAILKAISVSPTGVKGLARTLLAFTILTVIAVITAGLLVGEQSGDLELMKQVLTTLLAALTTIVGFYFGARTAQDSSAAGAAEALGGQPRGNGGGSGRKGKGDGGEAQDPRDGRD